MLKKVKGKIGIALPLTIIFAILKFCGCISWSWWWVFSPLWISALFVACVLGFIGAIIILVAICNK